MRRKRKKPIRKIHLTLTGQMAIEAVVEIDNLPVPIQKELERRLQSFRRKHPHAPLSLDAFEEYGEDRLAELVEDALCWMELKEILDIETIEDLVVEPTP